MRSGIRAFSSEVDPVRVKKMRQQSRDGATYIPLMHSSEAKNAVAADVANGYELPANNWRNP